MIARKWDTTRNIEDAVWAEFAASMVFPPADGEIDMARHLDEVEASPAARTAVRVQIEKRRGLFEKYLLPDEAYMFVWPQEMADVSGVYSNHDYCFVGTIRPARDVIIDVLSLPHRNNKAAIRHPSLSFWLEWMAIGIHRSEYSKHVAGTNRCAFTFRYGSVIGTGYSLRERLTYWRGVLGESASCS